MKNIVVLFLFLALISQIKCGAVSPSFLDMVSLRCLDKILDKKDFKESQLKPLATAVANEILETLSFLETQYHYQVAVVLGNQRSEGYVKIEQNFTGKVLPTKDVVHYKFYPMGIFSAYTFIYAGWKKYFLDFHYQN